MDARECDGHFAGECEGVVRLVNVADPGGLAGEDRWDFGDWFYCEKAIEADRKAGYLVTVKDEQEQP